jgi:hypothetical protein
MSQVSNKHSQNTNVKKNSRKPSANKKRIDDDEIMEIDEDELRDALMEDEDFK